MDGRRVGIGRCAGLCGRVSLRVGVGAACTQLRRGWVGLHGRAGLHAGGTGRRCEGLHGRVGLHGHELHGRVGMRALVRLGTCVGIQGMCGVG